MRISALLGCTAAVAVLGCRRDERLLPSLDQEISTVDDAAKGGGPRALGPTVGDAVGLLAAHRCDRERRCGHVGEARDFADDGQCLAASRLAIESEGYLQRCATRVDASSLEGCGRALADLPCTADVVTMKEISACRPSDLCREGD